MSNNKQLRIYQCVELLNKGITDLGIKTKIGDENGNIHIS
jgi:hypothetical protein